MTIVKLVEKVASKISDLFEGFSILVYKKTKYSKDGIIDGEIKIQLDNRLDMIVYFLLENGKITTNNETLNQTIDYNLTMNIVLKDDKFEIENTVSCLNSILFQENIFITDVDFNADKNLKNDWKISEDKYPYNYTALSFKATIENMNLIECNTITCKE